MKQKPRINYQITSPTVRLIDEEGKQVGIVSIKEALKIAQEKELDLVEISKEANPPICKILDFGKYLYEQSKKEQKQKAKSRADKLKEVRISARISDHDLQTKINQARKFLEKKYKVSVSLFLKGREMAHPDFAKRILEKFTAALSGIAEIEKEAGINEKQRNVLSIVFRSK